VIRPRRTLTALGALLALAVPVGVSACGGSGSSSATADALVTIGSADGTTIGQSQFEHWLVVAAASSTASPTGATQQVVVPQPPSYTACIAHQRATAPKPATGQKAETTADFRTSCKQEYDSLGSQVLSFLISSQWVLSEAAQQHVSVTPQAVMKEYTSEKKAQFKTAAAFTNFLKSSQFTVADLLFRIKVNLLSDKIRAKVTKSAGNISAAAISAYYAAHQSQYGSPAQRNLLLILTKTAAQAKAAEKQIQGGTPFSTVAKKVSIDKATQTKGGVLDGVSQGTEAKALDTAIFSAPLNKLTGPVSTPDGFYVFEVTKSTPSSQKPLAAVSATIKTQLASTAENTALTGFVNSFQKRWKGRTTCTVPFVTPFMLSSYCSNVKAPKATGTTGASGAVTATPTVSASTTPAG
jgi:foldase protein PrsA